MPLVRPQAIRMELLPSRERAPEQLRAVPRCPWHLDRAAQCQRPGAPRAHDGWRGRCYKPPTGWRKAGTLCWQTQVRDFNEPSLAFRIADHIADNSMSLLMNRNHILVNSTSFFLFRIANDKMSNLVLTAAVLSISLLKQHFLIFYSSRPKDETHLLISDEDADDDWGSIDGTVDLLPASALKYSNRNLLQAIQVFAQSLCLLLI